LEIRLCKLYSGNVFCFQGYNYIKDFHCEQNSNAFLKWLSFF
jgi:hypothetical protein